MLRPERRICVALPATRSPTPSESGLTEPPRGRSASGSRSADVSLCAVCVTDEPRDATRSSRNPGRTKGGTVCHIELMDAGSGLDLLNRNAAMYTSVGRGVGQPVQMRSHMRAEQQRLIAPRGPVLKADIVMRGPGGDNEGRHIRDARHRVRQDETEFNGARPRGDLERPACHSELPLDDSDWGSCLAPAEGRQQTAKGRVRDDRQRCKRRGRHDGG